MANGDIQRQNIKEIAAQQGIGQDPPAATDAILKEKANGLPSWCTIAQLIPAGGSAGQALTKVDGVDYNLVWATPAGGGGGGGGGSGDMLAATYDPQNIAGDAFARSNHTGTQLLSTISDAGALASFDTVATAQIADDAVTLAKQAHGTANRLMGYNDSGVPVEITAGSGISITGAEITATGGGGGTGGAPLGVSYLVLSHDVDLTNERALTVSGGLQATDGGANGTYTISGGQLQTMQRESKAVGTYQITANDLGKILSFTVATTVTVATGISIAAGDFYCVIEKATGATGDVTFNPTGITHQPQGGALPSYVISAPGGQATIYQKGGGDIYGTVGAWALPVKSVPVSADHVLGEDSANAGRPILIPVSGLGSGGGGGSGDATSLRGVALDGSVATPSDGNVLVYRSAGSDWVLEAKATGGGDMLSTTYDPQGIAGDSFNLSNHTGQLANHQYADESIDTNKLQLLTITGGRIADNTISGGKIIPGTVGNVRLSDTAAGMIKGRGDGQGTGPPQDLSADSVQVILRFARTATLPSAISGTNSGMVLRVSGTGTTTLPTGATLGVGFHCTIVNPTGSGFTRTIDGPGAINPTIAAGETATINVLDNGAIAFAKGVGQIL